MQPDICRLPAALSSNTSTLAHHLPRAGLLSRWILHGPAAVVHTALASLVLLRLHPRPMAHTPSFEFTTSFMGVRDAGLACGMGVEGCWVGLRHKKLRDALQRVA